MRSNSDSKHNSKHNKHLTTLTHSMHTATYILFHPAPHLLYLSTRPPRSTHSIRIPKASKADTLTTQHVTHTHSYAQPKASKTDTLAPQHAYSILANTTQCVCVCRLCVHFPETHCTHTTQIHTEQRLRRRPHEEALDCICSCCSCSSSCLHLRILPSRGKG